MSLDRDETAPDRYAVTIDRDPDAMVVTVEGEIDMDSATRLEETLAELIGRGEVDLVVDMSAVSFIDSVGTSVLVESLDRATEAGGTLAVRAPSTAVKRMLEITGEERLHLT